MTALAPGDRAPEFTLDGIDGRSRSLRHDGAEPALLVFFKNSCPTCMLALPFLQRLFTRLEKAPLNFWGISQDGADETRAFGEQYGITFPLLPDGAGYPVSNDYHLTNVPTLFLVESGGAVSRASVGFSKAELESLSADLQGRFGIPAPGPLFTASDEVPALKPG